MDSLKIEFPSQNDVVAWARMFAAARGADVAQNSDVKEVREDPLTWARLDTLLPVARELCDANVRHRASFESQKIDTVRRHCGAFVPRIDSTDDLSTHYQHGAAKQWPINLCQDEADQLLFPTPLESLRPVSSDVLVALMIPQTLMLHRIYWAAINARLSTAEKLYIGQMSKAISSGRVQVTSDIQPLLHMRFFDAVRKRAPPLVDALPRHWTLPGMTDEMIEALLALLKLSRTRPLAQLVTLLSNDEYAFLVEERKCLSHVLDTGIWTDDCKSGRSLDYYKEFVRVLRRDGGFKGSLKTVPPIWKMATASRHWDLSRSGPAPAADDLYPAQTSLVTKWPVVARNGWSVKRQRSQAAGIGTFTARRPRTVANPGVEGLLARDNSATAVSGVSVPLLSAAGAVAALGLVLLFAFIVFRQRSRRQRSRRVVGGRSPAHLG